MRLAEETTEERAERLGRASKAKAAQRLNKKDKETPEETTARLAGKRVLITQADDYMGPATTDLFREEGAEVIADTRDLTADGACETNRSVPPAD